MSIVPYPESSPVDLSVPIRFDGTQPALFGLPRASRAWARTEGFSGQVAAGASCNVETLTITPHVHGTHTECVGHITKARISLLDVWRPTLLRALLVTVRSGNAVAAPQAVPQAEPQAGVEAAELAAAVRAANRIGQNNDTQPPEAIILRTQSQTSRYLSADAAAWIRSSGFRHLLIDAPSVDPMDDGGRLAAHRAFWGLAPGSVVPEAITPGADPLKMTITELIRVPGSLEDGFGWLDLHMPPFDSDAAPSRPLFYPDHADYPDSSEGRSRKTP